MERVRFLGYVDDETLAGLYANATLFVLPSREEGFGLPALEAMASGTPVLVSDGGALPEVVGEAGMIFCLSNPDGLTSALKECLSSAGLRSTLKEKGLARAMKFSWQATAESVWKSLNEI
jgi:glycosyltransferase involved in cell wall biosynthesis